MNTYTTKTKTEADAKEQALSANDRFNQVNTKTAAKLRNSHKTSYLQEVADIILDCNSTHLCHQVKYCRRCKVKDRKVNFATLVQAVKQMDYKAYFITASFGHVEPARIKEVSEVVKKAWPKFRDRHINGKLMLGDHYVSDVSTSRIRSENGTVLDVRAHPHVHSLLFVLPGIILDRIHLKRMWKMMTPSSCERSVLHFKVVGGNEEYKHQSVEKIINYQHRFRKVLFNEDLAVAYAESIYGQGVKLHGTSGLLKKICAIETSKFKHKKFYEEWPNLTKICTQIEK